MQLEKSHQPFRWHFVSGWKLHGIRLRGIHTCYPRFTLSHQDVARADNRRHRRRAPRVRWSSTKNWDEHVENMERLAHSPAFMSLRDLILKRACLHEGDRLLDIGSGTGLLALSAAPRVGHVYALDASPAMC